MIFVLKRANIGDIYIYILILTALNWLDHTKFSDLIYFLCNQILFTTGYRSHYCIISKFICIYMYIFFVYGMAVYPPPIMYSSVIYCLHLFHVLCSYNLVQRVRHDVKKCLMSSKKFVMTSIARHDVNKIVILFKNIMAQFYISTMCRPRVINDLCVFHKFCDLDLLSIPVIFLDNAGVIGSNVLG